MGSHDKEKTMVIQQVSDKGNDIDCIIGEYTLLKEIGRGAMGVVYKARHTGLESIRAVKVLAQDLAKKDEFLRRFEREAKIASNFQHPNIVTIHDIGANEGAHYISMEYVDGVTLKEILERKIPLSIALLIILEVCKALEYVHDKKITYRGEMYGDIVHRDIKPANIMVTHMGNVKLTDFGIARPVNITDETITGTMIGTISYMSPEQLNGQAVDRRTDIYSLGVVLYEMITCQKPFGGEPITKVIQNIASGNYLPLQRLLPSLPKKVSAIVSKAIDMDKNKRYQNISDMANDICNLLPQEIVSVPEKAIADYLKNGAAILVVKERKKGRLLLIIGVVGLLIMLLAAAMKMFAPTKLCNIVVNTDMTGIQVELDGQRFSAEDKTYVLIPDVPKGIHALRVVSINDKTRLKEQKIEVDETFEIVRVKLLEEE
ncbi:MAG: serine/threonine-protein kinase [bacterium]|nr:serine/threonine-protein kinase [bacterium]